MDNQEEQLHHLRMRVQNLERSLHESEALSLEQIECTHRLEQQLFDTRNLLVQKEHELQECRRAQQSLEDGPSAEDYRLQAQHIEELQQLIWDLERRPTQDHYQILHQQLVTSQAEIEMLKAELERRVDPVRFQQLQQELRELKSYAEQLGDYAARFPQVQLQQAQVGIENQELKTEIESLKAQLAAQSETTHSSTVEDPTPAPQDPSALPANKLPTEVEEQIQAEVEERVQALDSEYVTIQSQLRQQLREAQDQVQELQNRAVLANETQWRREIERLHRTLSTVEAERDQLLSGLAARIAPTSESLDPAVALDPVEPTEDVATLQKQVELLQFQLNASEEALAQRPTSAQLTSLEAELDEAKAELAVAHQAIESNQSSQDRVEERFRILEASLNDMDQSLTEQTAYAEELSAQVAERDRDLQTLRNELEQRPTAADWEQLNQRATALDQQITAARQALDQRPTPDQWHQLQTALAAMESDLAAALTELNQRPTLDAWEHLQYRVQAAESELATVRAQGSNQPAADERVHQLEATLTDLQTRLTAAEALEAQLTTLQSHAADLETRPAPEQVAEWLQRIDALQAQVSNAQYELAHRPTADDQAQWERHLEQLQAEYDAMAEQLASLTRQLSSAHTQIQELQQRPTLLQAQEWQQRIQDLQTQLAHSQVDLAQRPAASETEALIHQVTGLETELQTLQSAYQALQQSHQTQQSEAYRTLEAEVAQLQETLQSFDADRQRLAQELELRPTLRQFQEVKRKQELAEAHHVVGKKQVERLQEKIQELEAECVQAHAYAQTQEKEVAHLERAKQELESQIAFLSTAPTSAQRAELAGLTVFPLSATHRSVSEEGPVQPQVEQSPAAASSPLEAPAETQPKRSPVHPSFRPRRSSIGIPPLTFNAGSEASGSLSQRPKYQSWARRPLPPEDSSVKKNRVELPTFVQRR